MSISARDRFLGCLLGGGIGDALGAPVEFLSRSEILRSFGPDGIPPMRLPTAASEISPTTRK
jgi:ADP-ribosylglycohydrolase